ncbi:MULTISPECIES: cbb3-type cytochrome oxidase assembly protein CcoS [unclassified Yoonia]|uniref:cbb3-type cytochrome oxidase assembly protein CcoS n=1 Tax=unclassified Yoonia TaxID=2629118 RepID=UPI002AFF1435|nr:MULTISPECIES: cbb3-type cytochrome oxidase assembly protein CcoS [unclassified Yoonia]
MNVLVILIPVSLVLGALGLVAFLWSLRANQYEDLEGDAWRILSDDDTRPPE